MRLTALLVSLWALNGCGGAMSHGNGGSEGGSSGGGAPAGGAAAGGSNGGAATTRAGATSEPLGDPTDPSYPTVPPGSGAFFWRYGLGNWFVSRSDGTSGDATFESEDGIATWKAEGSAHQSLDLWAQLDHPQGRPIDLSAYSGVSFDAQLTGASAQLVLVFNATGHYEQAFTALNPQRFGVTSDWQTFQLRFSDIGSQGGGTTSFDFVVTDSNAPFVLKVRSVALLCEAGCP